MNIVCSDTVTFGKEAFSTLGNVTLLPPREINADSIRTADILVIRSTTRVNSSLFEPAGGRPKLRFVGTATIGYNHIDVPFLAANGIPWRAAPGCNANSVAEYVAAALLHLSETRALPLKDRTLGVIGVGNVGSLVVQKAAALGPNVLQNDPPREQNEGSLAGTNRFVTLDSVLAESDIITVHVPLTRTGPFATRHMANDSFFSRMKNGAIFINTSRGAVMDSASLQRALANGTVAHAVIDTWEHEPDISRELLDSAAIGTPHIAGYSFDGKVAGTVIVYHEVCAFLAVEPVWSPAPLMPPAPVPQFHIDAAGKTTNAAINAAVKSVYDIQSDDRALRAATNRPMAAHFDSLRNNYRDRREWQFTQVAVANDNFHTARTLAALGFRTTTLP